MRPIRLGKAALELNVGLSTLVDFLESKGVSLYPNPNTKLTPEQFELLRSNFVHQEYHILPGNAFWVTVVKKIEPGVLVVDLNNEFRSILNLRDLSKNLITAERHFQKNMSVGSSLRIVITQKLDNKWFRCKLDKSQLLSISPVEVSSINIGQRVNGKEHSQLYTNRVFELEGGLLGLLNKEIEESGDLYVSRKDADSGIVYLNIKKAEEKPDKKVVDSTVQDLDVFIARPEFKDWESFCNSKYYNYASEEDLQTLEKCYSVIRNPQAPVITPNHPLKLYFEFNSPSWEGLKLTAKMLGYTIDETFSDEEAEKEGLNQIESEHYWVNNNTYRGTEQVLLFSEKYSLVAEVEPMDDFAIKLKVILFNLGRTYENAGKAKRYNMGNGAQVLNGKIELINPLKSYSAEYDQHHYNFFEGLKARSKAEKLINSLKEKNSEILKTEGKALEIFQKYLDYEIKRLKESQPEAMPLILNERIPNTDGFVSYRMDSEVYKEIMRQSSNENDVVHVEISKRIETPQGKSRFKFQVVEKGIVRGSEHSPIIDLFNLDQLDPEESYYISPLVSTKAQSDQKKIIRQFLNGEIDVDHIEKLFTNPESIVVANREQVQMNNPILDDASKSANVSKQVQAVERAVGNSNLFLIQGPPGTGKTTVITEIVKQLVHKGERILVSGQTNVAVDNVLEKLAAEDEILKLRIGNKNSASETAQKFTIESLIERYKTDLVLFSHNQQIILRDFDGSNDDEIFQKLNWGYDSSFIDYSRQLHEQTLNILKNKATGINSTQIEHVLKDWGSGLRMGMDDLLEPLIYLSADVTFGTCVGAGMNTFLRNQELKFDTVIIDEAGKANLSETLVAMSLGRKVILVGDHKQLPPYFDSEAINEDVAHSFPNSKLGSRYTMDEIKHSLTVSFFEFIKNKEKQGLFPSDNVIMLDEQHRMHPNIGEFVSEQFYQDNSSSGLKMGGSTHLNTMNISDKYRGELIFFDTSKSRNGVEKRVQSSDRRSITNPFEAHLIVNEILQDFEENGVNVDEVAIVSPYSAQVNLIRQELERSNLASFKSVEVATLDSFQGKEFDVIIFSFTRSMPAYWNDKLKVGFLDDSRRLNVSFSRAKKKLVMVGNSQTLTDPRRHDETLFNFSGMFSRLIENCKDPNKGSFHIRSGSVIIGQVDEAPVEEPLSSEEITNNRSQILSSLEVGQVLKGKVKNIKDYGVFVDLGGVDGMIYIADLSWSRFTDPYKLVEIGQKVAVKVVSFNEDKSRIGLSLKLMQPNPWDSVKGSLKEGEKTTGRIVEIKDYGLFLELIPGVEGLLHKTEIGWTNGNTNLNKIFKKGDELEVLIKSIDEGEKKIAVSRKDLATNPWDNIDDLLSRGDIVTGKVVTLTKFGVFINIAPGLNGLMHISDITSQVKVDHPGDYFKKNDEITVVVLSVDKEKQRISLGQKQLDNSIRTGGNINDTDLQRLQNKFNKK